MMGVLLVAIVCLAGPLLPAERAVAREARSPTRVAAAPVAALAGTVSSVEAGAMEGVLVSAKREGATITVTVDSDAQGRYSFPRNRLEPGKYALRIRAVGYELDGAASAEVTADKTATADLKLRKAKDLAAQLTNTEWLMSMPGTDEQKYMLSNCGNCHTYERIVRSQFSADDFIDILKLMASFAQGATPTHPAKRGLEQVGPTGMLGTPKTAEFLSTINLSNGADQWAYALKTLPRPTGRATHVIVTEYDLARRHGRCRWPRVVSRLCDGNYREPRSENGQGDRLPAAGRERELRPRRAGHGDGQVRQPVDRAAVGHDPEVRSQNARVRFLECEREGEFSDDRAGL
jgi:hypothetical protein